jgi:hypothetical protein
MLINAGFECSIGTSPMEAPQGGQMQIHNGWTVDLLAGTPWVYSASMQFNGGVCGGDAHVEKIEGSDSLAVFAHDLEWTDKPGKPFDVAVYQQVKVNKGSAYSLSAWMLSLCGGSAMPNDCPQGHYISKMLGIDPTGGIDARADTVVWVEDRRNFVENGQRVGWTNLRMAVLAESDTITVFGRINSPFQWHGNHAFIDAFSLVEAPTAVFLPGKYDVDGYDTEIAWEGTQSQQIGLIPGGTYELKFDIEYKFAEDGAWQRWLSNEAAGKSSFTCKQAGIPHFFRVRARAEQPSSGPAGAWPNHRYPGVWSEPITITFRQEPPQHKLYIPKVER